MPADLRLGAQPSGHFPHSCVIAAGEFTPQAPTLLRPHNFIGDASLFGLRCSPPRLQITGDAGPGQVALQWSTGYSDYHLESTHRLPNSGPGSFRRIQTAPAVIDNRYTVTNSASETAEFYRLVK
jgi:hypothetical protein